MELVRMLARWIARDAMWSSWEKSMVVRECGRDSERKRVWFWGRGLEELMEDLILG